VGVCEGPVTTITIPRSKMVKMMSLTALLKEEIASWTSSSDKKVTNPKPLDFELPGTWDTFIYLNNKVSFQKKERE
jgi:hypothetical protein